MGKIWVNYSILFSCSLVQKERRCSSGEKLDLPDTQRGIVIVMKCHRGRQSNEKVETRQSNIFKPHVQKI